MLSGSREARAATREPQPGSSVNADDLGGPIVTHSVVKSRATVTDLAAWRRMRNHPGAGDWWGSAGEMWSWSKAEASRWGWSA